MPVVCYRPARSNLTVITRYFSLNSLTITTGMCLMNVYEFVKVLPAPQSFRDKRRNRWIKIFLFPPVSSLKCYFSTHYLKIFFKFLIAAFTDFATI